MTDKKITHAAMDEKTKACFGPHGFWYVTALQGEGSWHGSAYVPGGAKQPEESNITHLKVWGSTELETKRKLFTALSNLAALDGVEIGYLDDQSVYRMISVRRVGQ